VPRFLFAAHVGAIDACGIRKGETENDGRTRSCGARRNECRSRRALKKKTAPAKPRDAGGPSGPRALRTKQYESGGHLRFKRGKETKMVKIFNRKFAAALLAAAMALTVFAWSGEIVSATGNDVSYTVEIQMYDESLDSITSSIEKSTFTIGDAYWWKGSLPVGSQYGPYVFNPEYNPTVLDATTLALGDDGMGIWYPENNENSDWGWDLDTLYNGTIEWIGVWVDGIFGEYIAEDPLWSSPSHWAGYAWMLTVIDENDEIIIDGAGPMDAGGNLYSSNVEIEDGMTIIWNYTWYETDID
jgi:hypothetical protein